MPIVKFLPGDGTEVEVDVAYIGQTPKGPDGTCAFCHGDPCADNPGARETDIGRYFASCSWADTCPMCHGAPI